MSIQISARIETSEKKEKFEEILNRLGLSVSGAINIFVQQVINNNGLPFSMVLPETEEEKTLKAITSYNNGNRVYVTDEELDKTVAE
jgi:DNA-damage-inducible protein J